MAAFPENYTPVPGIAQAPELASGNPANLPPRVTGVDQARNRIHVGGNGKSYELSLLPDKAVKLGADPVVELLPAGPVVGQRYSIGFKGMASEHDVTIDSNGTPFNKLADDGQTYELLCAWDVPYRYSTARFECVKGDDNQPKWEIC